MSNGGDNKRVIIISVSAVVLIVIGAAVTIGFVVNQADENSNKNGGDIASTTKAVQAICQPTDFKETCVRSLKNSNTSDPKELIKTGFKAAKRYLAEAAKKSVALQEIEKDPRASQALKSCKELMDSAIDDLEHSLERFGEFNVGKLDELLLDLRVWLSATITYQETCIDAFKNTTTPAGKKMTAALKIGKELSSNGLAMVSEISSVLTSLNLVGSDRRRLLGLDIQGAVLGHEDDEIKWEETDLLRRRLLAANPSDIKPDLIVAKDGSGKYKTIGEALKDVPLKGTNTFVLYIKEGVYQEEVVFEKEMTNLMVIGDGPTKTRITSNKNYIDGTPTFKTATVAVKGDSFVARDIGFENSAGASKHQAVALRVQSDKAVFYNCHMDGYQDTLYVHTKRQFYRDCTISGTIDFVFGDSPVVFQNCKFLIRKPLDNQQCIVTAQGRKERRQPSAIIIQNCTFTADESYLQVKAKFKSYLGRPWKEHSRTIIMESYIDDIIHPDGWLPWSGNFGLNSCFYAEFKNKGPGADTSKRVTWRGIKTITPKHAQDFTSLRFLQGDRWIPKTGVPYTAGMFHN